MQPVDLWPHESCSGQLVFLLQLLVGSVENTALFVHNLVTCLSAPLDPAAS